ncbi:hypothetical protein A3K72_01260 [Candidatus Woesearchaeota archaeon RBG_13_36_6]|nr:MAG: hypothetical protein A3K72_01260 [Candidatus Woesearchaeota archaeon RBG_13_36_6]
MPNGEGSERIPTGGSGGGTGSRALEFLTRSLEIKAAKEKGGEKEPSAIRKFGGFLNRNFRSSVGGFLGYATKDVRKILGLLETTIFANLARIAFVVIFVSFLFIGQRLIYAPAKVYAAEEDMTIPEAILYKTQETITKTAENILKPIDAALDKFEYITYRQFVETEYVNEQWYGIKLTVEPRKDEFSRTESVEWIGVAKVGYFKEVEEKNVDIECDIEDGTNIKIENPLTGTIPIKQLAMGGQKVIKCSADSIPSGGNKDASITLKFPFIAKASLPVSIMDANSYEVEYEQRLDQMIELEVENPSKEAAFAVAKQVNVKPEEKAETYHSLVEIGAQMVEYQPLRKDPKAKEDFTLKIMVWNKGEGTAKITNMDITSEGNIQFINVDPDQFTKIKPLTPDDAIKTFYIDVDISGFELNPSLAVTGTRISIVVNYEYNITRETEVKIELPPEILGGEELTDDEGKSTPGKASPLPQPPEGYDGSRGPYIDLEDVDKLDQDFIDVYTGKITRNQGGAPIPFNAQPGETLKSITDQIAAQYNIDPALLATIEAEETGMHYVNRVGELCKPENTGKSYLTGCGAYTSCVCGDSTDCKNNPECKCPSSSLDSDEAQIRCTALTLRMAYDHSTTDGLGEYGGSCIRYKNNPNDVWTCIFCKYAGQSTTDFGECVWDDQIIRYYKTWKKYYPGG